MALVVYNNTLHNSHFIISQILYGTKYYIIVKN